MAYRLQDLTYQAAEKMGVQLSQCAKLERDDAIALTSLVRSWDSVQERIRIHRGKPMPGSRRPAPEPEKSAKVQHLNRPPDVQSQSNGSAPLVPKPRENTPTSSVPEPVQEPETPQEG